MSWLCQIYMVQLWATFAQELQEELVCRQVLVLVITISYSHKEQDMLVWILQEWMLSIQLLYSSPQSLCFSIWDSHSSLIEFVLQLTKLLLKENIVQEISEELQQQLNTQKLSFKILTERNSWECTCFYVWVILFFRKEGMILITQILISERKNLFI